jgi:hypothetical protein
VGATAALLPPPPLLPPKIRSCKQKPRLNPNMPIKKTAAQRQKANARQYLKAEIAKLTHKLAEQQAINGFLYRFGDSLVDKTAFKALPAA